MLMLEGNRSCLYNKNHVLPIFDKNGQMEEKRTLNLTIHNINDSVEIKIRDSTEYSFNFSTNIDLTSFEIIRNAQSLDINFTEFKSNLLEMLQQFQREEMFLKCIKLDTICTLVFYGRSKIKSIVYLTLDLQETNQREILNELINSLQKMQAINEKLKNQLVGTQRSMFEKDEEITNLHRSKKQLQTKFYADFRQVEAVLATKLKETELLLLNSIASLMPKFARLLTELEILKMRTASKDECNNRLRNSLEKLRVESTDNMSYINRLKQENNALHAVHANQEKNLNELRKALSEKDAVLIDLQNKNKELRSDLETATIAITRKKATIDELSKDLVQANQMIVNFNNHYESKVRQVEELQASLEFKERTINEQRQTYNGLVRDFESYKATFNEEGQQKLKHDLSLANSKIDELEAALRKANKINALLTDKVNQHQRVFNNN